MLLHPTLDQLHALGLHGMAKAFVDAGASGDTQALSHADRRAVLLDRETALRADKRLSARLRHARLRNKRRRRMSTTAARAVLIARCFRNFCRARGSMSMNRR